MDIIPVPVKKQEIQKGQADPQKDYSQKKLCRSFLTAAGFLKKKPQSQDTCQNHPHIQKIKTRTIDIRAGINRKLRKVDPRYIDQRMQIIGHHQQNKTCCQDQQQYFCSFSVVTITAADADTGDQEERRDEQLWNPVSIHSITRRRDVHCQRIFENPEQHIQ